MLGAQSERNRPLYPKGPLRGSIRDPFPQGRRSYRHCQLEKLGEGPLGGDKRDKIVSKGTGGKARKKK